jgi:hypothetical protein
MPSGYQVEIELKGFEEFKEKLRQAPDIVADVKYKMMDAMVTIAREKAMMEAPIDTGNLSKNIGDNSKVVTMGNDLYGVVGTTITSKGGFPYPQVQEYGSGIYGPKGTPITPKKKKLLAWPAFGSGHKFIATGISISKTGKIRRNKKKDVYLIFAKQVSGVKPKYFMKKAAEEVKRRSSEILKIGLEIVNKLSFSS